jgi:hypothetical protein
VGKAVLGEYGVSLQFRHVFRNEFLPAGPIAVLLLREASQFLNVIDVPGEPVVGAPVVSDGLHVMVSPLSSILPEIEEKETRHPLRDAGSDVVEVRRLELLTPYMRRRPKRKKPNKPERS